MLPLNPPSLPLLRAAEFLDPLQATLVMASRLAHRSNYSYQLPTIYGVVPVVARVAPTYLFARELCLWASP